eukprot:scaffold11024_cov77-Skeletonema_dohrnii-CCMP3373.AAC.1
MTMLNPTRKIQLANPFMHCPQSTTAIPPQTRSQIQQKRHPLPSQSPQYQLIPPPPAGVGTASSLTIPTKIEDRAIRANVSPNSLPPPVNVFRQSVQPNLFKNILPRWIRPLSSLAVLLRSIPSHTAGSSIIEAFQTPHRQFSQHPSLTPIQ